MSAVFIFIAFPAELVNSFESFLCFELGQVFGQLAVWAGRWLYLLSFAELLASFGLHETVRVGDLAVESLSSEWSVAQHGHFRLSSLHGKVINLVLYQAFIWRIHALARVYSWLGHWLLHALIFKHEPLHSVSQLFAFLLMGWVKPLELFLLLSREIFNLESFSLKLKFKLICALLECSFIVFKLIDSPLQGLKMNLELVLWANVVSNVVLKLSNDVLVLSGRLVAESIA